MRRPPLLVAAAAIGALSVLGLVRAVASSAPPLDPVALPTPEIGAAFARFGEVARGRRVLVVSTTPGRPNVVSIRESGRAPEGWRAYPGSPPEATEFGAALDALAAACRDWGDADRTPGARLAGALELFGVKGVVAGAAGAAASGRAFDRADPVVRLDDGPGEAGAAGSGPVELAARLRWTPARESEGWTFADDTDELWGGGVTIDTRAPGRFLFPHPAKGGTVTVDGRPAARIAVGPLLALDLPAGRSRVEVSFVAGGSDETLTLLSAAGLFAALGMALVSLRPSRAAVEAAAAADAEDSAP